MSTRTRRQYSILDIILCKQQHVKGSTETMKAILFLVLFNRVAADLCDVYTETKRQLNVFNTQKWSIGDMVDKVSAFQTENAAVTVNGATKSLRNFFKEFELELRSMQVDLHSITCAPHQWCLAEVMTVYADEQQNAVSYKQFWTFLFDPDTCLVNHFFVLNDNRDVSRLIQAFSTGRSDKEL